MNRILVLVLLLAGLTAQLLGAETRTFAPDRAAISINGKAYPGTVAWSGGDPRGTVQTKGTNKQIVGVTYDPIIVQVSGALQSPLAEIVKEFCEASPSPVSLVLHTTNAPALEANKAVLTKVEFPALSGASKEAARVLLTFNSPAPRVLPGAASAAPGPAKTKYASAANFRFSVDGLPSNRIAEVSSLVVSRESGRNEIANLIISIGAADAEAWMQWRDASLVTGKNSEAQEKKATLTLLDPGMKEALLTLTLPNVGLVFLGSPARDADKLSRLEAELYVESVSVSPAPTK